MEGILCGWLVFGVFCALVGSGLAATKGRGAEGFFLGLFLGPIGLVIALLLPEAGVQCPFCKGVVGRGAVKCKNCGSDLSENLAPKTSLPPCPRCGRVLVRTRGLANCRGCRMDFEIAQLTESRSTQEQAEQVQKAGLIRFICPRCKEKNSVSESLAGKKVLCQSCNSPCTVPEYL